LYSPFEKEKKSERPCNSVTGGRIYERWCKQNGTS
jgi:hypothetical protein